MKGLVYRAEIPRPCRFFACSVGGAICRIIVGGGFIDRPQESVSCSVLPPSGSFVRWLCFHPSRVGCTSTSFIPARKEPPGASPGAVPSRARPIGPCPRSCAPGSAPPHTHFQES